MLSFINSVVVELSRISIFLLAVFSIVLYIKDKKPINLLLCVGLCAMVLGRIIEYISPYAIYTMKEGGPVVSKINKTSWYFFYVLHNLGLFLTTIAFGCITFFKKKKSKETKSET